MYYSLILNTVFVAAVLAAPTSNKDDKKDNKKDNKGSLFVPPTVSWCGDADCRVVGRPEALTPSQCVSSVSNVDEDDEDDDISRWTGFSGFGSSSFFRRSSHDDDDNDNDHDKDDKKDKKHKHKKNKNKNDDPIVVHYPTVGDHQENCPIIVYQSVDCSDEGTVLPGLNWGPPGGFAKRSSHDDDDNDKDDKKDKKHKKDKKKDKKHKNKHNDKDDKDDKDEEEYYEEEPVHQWYARQAGAYGDRFDLSPYGSLQAHCGWVDPSAPAYPSAPVVVNDPSDYKTEPAVVEGPKDPKAEAPAPYKSEPVAVDPPKTETEGTPYKGEPVVAKDPPKEVPAYNHDPVAETKETY